MIDPPFKRLMFIGPAVFRNLVDTITSLDSVSYTFVCVDEAGAKGPCDAAVERAVRDFAPDIAIFIPSIVVFEFMPSRRCLERLRWEGGIPVVQLYTDLAKPVWQLVSARLVLAADLAVSVDGSTNDLPDPAVGKVQWRALWAPNLPPDLGPIDRDIDVSMIGSLTSFPHRREYVEHLQRNGIDVVTGGGVETSYGLSIEDYYRFLFRSKIVFNIGRPGERNFDVDGKPILHLKGRVMESLAAGAFVLELQNAVTAKFLTDGADYVSFTDADDLVAKIRYFLAHDDERRTIAEHGRRTYTERYTARIFWETLLSAAASAVQARLPSRPGLPG